MDVPGSDDVTPAHTTVNSVSVDNVMTSCDTTSRSGLRLRHLGIMQRAPNIKSNTE